MNPAERKHSPRTALIAVLLLSVIPLASCGSGKHDAGTDKAASRASVAPETAVVVRIGTTLITGAMYDHWMTIGAATVEKPKPNGSLPKPVPYEPPKFTACVARLRDKTRQATPVAPLQAECKATYEGIQDRILSFLITGYWLRGEAAEKGLSVSVAEVKKKFDEEKRENYPTAASFRRLQEASKQTIPDLEFAIETQMLSTKLLGHFAAEHGEEKYEEAAVPGFNKSIRAKWRPRTSCQPGYVVPDCKQYKEPLNAKPTK
jgi:hypothetical protein